MSTGTPTILERIINIEESVKNLDGVLADQDQRIANVLASVTAQLKSAVEDTLLLVEAGHEILARFSSMGSNKPKDVILESIELEVKKKKYFKLVKMFEINKAKFMEEVEAGKFVKVDTVIGNPIVVGRATNPDGTPYGSGYFLSSLNGLGKEMADFFTGKKALEEVFVNKDGVNVTIDEIYEAV